jgi:hypothetical protein
MLSTAIGLACLAYLSRQRTLTLSRGAAWRHLHRASYALIMLLLLFQARAGRKHTNQAPSQSKHPCARGAQTEEIQLPTANRRKKNLAPRALLFLLSFCVLLPAAL